MLPFDIFAVLISHLIQVLYFFMEMNKMMLMVLMFFFLLSYSNKRIWKDMLALQASPIKCTESLSRGASSSP